MDWDGIGRTSFAVTIMIATFAAICALGSGLIVGLSRRLVGFRVPFVAAFKAVVATVIVTIFLRGIGGRINEVIGFGVGSAVMLAGVIYFLAWYLDRYVPRPDGTPLGRADGYRLALAYGALLIVLNLVARTVVDAPL
jgi:hypothetical protein